MTLRVCDLQSDSDLESIRNSCDVSLGDPCLLELAKVLLKRHQLVFLHLWLCEISKASPPLHRHLTHR